MQRKIALRLATAAALACAVLVALFVVPTITERSAPFAAIEQYVRSDPNLEKRIGAIRSVTVDRSERQSIVFGDGGIASLAIRVEGTKGAVRVRARASQEGETWKVISAETE